MSSLNKVMLIGNLGGDPEMRSTNAGKQIANFSLATSEQWKGSDGTKQSRTEWHRVVVFNEQLAGIVQKYVRKGSKVYIEGSVQTRKWVDQQGKDRYSTEIVLSQFNGKLVMLGDPGGARKPGEDHEEDDPPPQQRAASASARGATNYLDDDIPF